MTRVSIRQVVGSAILFGVAVIPIGCSSSNGGESDAASGGAAGQGDVAGAGGGTGGGGIEDAATDAAPATDVSGPDRALTPDGTPGTGGRPGSGGVTNAGGATSAGGATGAGGTSSATGGLGAGGLDGGGGAGTCIGSALLSSLGKDTVLVGGSMDDETAAAAPFDGRYLYLSGGFFDGSAPCASCASGCTAGGTSCANSGSGCAWWGCWQWDQDPPGQYVVDFVARNEGASPRQVPMLTYYEELQASGLGEGTAQVAALNDAVFLARYFADWRFFLRKIGTHPALLHIEPDLWGYVEHLDADPTAVPAKVTAANPDDCGSHENSAAGVAKCMIHMVRVHAPGAKVGLHASAWGTKMDVFGNRDAKLDVAAEARKLATFLTALGAQDGDFIVADPSDRDAGYYESQGRDTWWDETNATLPSFRQAFTWTKVLAEALGLPVIYWQIPLGNMSQADRTDHWKDNRVDYFFAHLDEVVDAHIAGLFFGAGAGGMTTPETDGGNLVAKTVAYRAAGGVKLCP